MTTDDRFSDRLNQAISVGMVEITSPSSARILAPPNADQMSDGDWLDVLAASSEMERELKTLRIVVTRTRHPGEFSTFCDRCKDYREDCLLVPYILPPRLEVPEIEPIIGVDYVEYRPVIDGESTRVKCAAMCSECRMLKEAFTVRD